VIGFLPAKFGLPKPFRSRVKLRHGTDRRTDRRTDIQTDIAAHFIMPPSLRGRSHNNHDEKLIKKAKQANNKNIKHCGHGHLHNPTELIP